MMALPLACEAMATRFEFVLVGENPLLLRAAGEEAFAEIHRLESVLSLFRPASEIAELNRTASLRPVRVSPEVFALVRHATLLSQATQGAFDITVGPLMQAWGLLRSAGRVPSPDELAAARRCVSFQGIELDDEASTIRFDRPGMMIDLGAIGKGYALDRAADLLRQAGVQHALVHGGTSTAVAWGRPLDTEAWRFRIDRPFPEPATGSWRSQPDAPPLAVLELRDESVSVSAVWGKGFRTADRYFGHVIDPRRGEPVRGPLLAAMVLPLATESDALSTALLVRGAEMVSTLAAQGAPCRCLVLEESMDKDAPGGRWRVTSRGIPAPID